MNNEELLCHTDLLKNAIEDEIFERELTLCKQLNHKQGKCNWGICQNCGVIPLLYKLHKGILLESPQEIEATREKIFLKE